MQNHRIYRFARLATMSIALYSFTTLHSATWTGGVKMEDRTAAESIYNTAIERLNRGLVAVCTDEGVFLSWRILATDSPDCAFDIYRDGKKINNTPITTGNYIDRDGNRLSRYEVKEGKEARDDHALRRKEQRMEGFMSGCRDTVTWTGQAKCVTPWANEYLTLNISRPADGYTPEDCSVADVDADGSYELILKWDPQNAHDNSHGGVTDAVFIDCYDIADCQPASDQLKWRINLGRNIRAGAHYTQFLAYDFDGDGRAEIACKTAPGTVDGKGVPVLLPGDSADADYVCREGRLIGRITGGPEYLTVFSGETGEALATVPYAPAYADIPDWGDDYFNRSERYLACVAVLGDGAEEPEVPERSGGTEMTGRRGRASMVFCRGYYTQANLAAYDFDGKNITLRWIHQSLTPGKDSAYGQGAHSLAVGDVDNDGCDEIIYGSATIDHNGSLLSSTGLGHGDALHLADILPDRPGLEVFMVHEGRNANCCAEIHDPVTGEILWREDSQNGRDNGRGVAMNLFADTKGYEWWSLSSNNIFTADGTTGRRLAVLADSSPKPTNFRIYWDGDLQDEPYDGNIVYKPLMTEVSSADSATVSFSPLATLKGSSCNGTKRTPNLLADIFGDWREEVVLYDKDTCDKLYIHTTTIPTEHRMTTLMHDHIYRMCIAWQNSAYNQPPHVATENQQIIHH